MSLEEKSGRVQEVQDCLCITVPGSPLLCFGVGVRKGTAAAPFPLSVPGARSWMVWLLGLCFARPGSLIHADLSAWKPSLCMGTAHCAHSASQAAREVPTQNACTVLSWICLLLVRFQWDLCICFLVHLSLNTPCLCRLFLWIWFWFWAYVKLYKLDDFWHTTHAFPAGSLALCETDIHLVTLQIALQVVLIVHIPCRSDLNRVCTTAVAFKLLKENNDEPKLGLCLWKRQNKNTN